MSGPEPAQVVQYEVEVSIGAAAAAVWHALTEETNAWWLPDFHMAGRDSVVRLEARAGGALVEASPDGSSLLWYQVQLCQPGDALHLFGFIGAAWGGPATSLLELTLTEGGGRTTLRVRDSLVGAVSAEGALQLQEGWQLLLTTGLAAYVERRGRVGGGS